MGSKRDRGLVDLRAEDYLPLLQAEPALWDLYTKREEYDATAHVTSQFYRDTLNARPLVSQFLVEKGYSIEYPEGRPFAICLTHDIDDVNIPATHLGRMALQRIRSGDFPGFRDAVLATAGRGRQEVYRNFLAIRRLEDEYGAGSTFFFLATDHDIIRFRYRIEDLAGDLGSLADTGAEIGLHGGFSTCGSPEGIRAEKGRLEKVLGRGVTGYRNHFLRFHVPDSWEYLAGAGFSYDSTLGYNHATGFRNGMAHPFRPFNLKTGTRTPILEIPLVVMERAYLNHGVTPARAWESIQSLLETVEGCHGVLTVNWHNTTLAGMPDRVWERMYRKILRYGRDHRAWMAGGAEIAGFWRGTGYSTDSGS